MKNSPAKQAINAKPAVVTPGAACVYSQTGDVRHDGEIVTVDSTPDTRIAAKRAQFIPLGETLSPDAMILKDGDVLLVPIYDESRETLLGHVEQIVHVVFYPRVNVSSLEADPTRPEGERDELSQTAYVHHLATAPQAERSHPVTGALKR
ncbi:hypothetical protein [Algisphaera agarilytica]|uniref:Uncharacterized protein n=1 Tax=Algisphaera agarilytica TaxID=1385975 RepID=A0A7X0H4M5_9BACT|nr:hypothetical protein [Algisphaera agarilytica]MBB6429207.1 hypothetical protein [Algisphaera agarilytica]